MSWTAVAKKDFRDAVQSRALWALLGVFVVLSVVLSYAYATFPELVGGTTEPTLGGLVFFTSGIVSLFVSLTAIVVCYKAIAGERELGSIKLMLALPHRRRDVFVGKLVGRTGVLTLALAVGLVVGLGLGSALIGSFELVPIAAFLFVTLLFAVVYVTIVVSLSATTGSTSRATTFALGFFLLFELLWDVVPLGVVYVANGFSLPAQMPDWIFPVMQLPPSSAYVLALSALLPDIAESAPGGGVTAGFDAFYARPELGFAVLAFWLVVPMAVGSYRFANADL